MDDSAVLNIFIFVCILYLLPLQLGSLFYLGWAILPFQEICMIGKSLAFVFKNPSWHSLLSLEKGPSV